MPKTSDNIKADLAFHLNTNLVREVKNVSNFQRNFQCNS